MQTLEALIRDNEDWLVDRVVHYALVEGFAEYTSTLREAWRASICGLSGPILEAVAAARARPGSNDGFGHARQSLVAFGVEQAARHRARGVRLGDFLGLLKYYRRAYLDLIEENDVAPADAKRLRGYILEFFDQVEIGLCTEWSAVPDDDRLRDLQEKAKRLANEKNKYLTIFESIREPVILLDPDDTPIHLNDAANRLFSGAGAPGASYYGPLHSPLLNSQIEKILKGSDETQADMEIETLAGVRDFNVKVQRMLDVSRKFDGTVIILNDVSEYKRALRQARAADHAKSTFLAAMSHEIRTPIAGSLGLARLLRATTLTEEQGRLVEGITSSAELLAGVVGGILDFSQAEVGPHPPAPQDFELAQLVRQVLMVVEPLAKEKNLELTTQISPDLPARLRADASMIRQVLLNLTHNAIKFTDAGSIHVRVSEAAEAGPGGRRLRFEVRDTGVGLPAGPTQRLFDPFFQGNRDGDRAKGGLGLGLAICSKIVDRMGGTIGCQANPTGGSLFFFDLPLELARESAVESGLPAPMRLLRILVVDDEPVSRMVAEGFVSMLGHTPVVVSSAAEALRRLDAETFDLVLTDNRMPDITGLELVERVEALKHGPNVGIPVIVLTASADDIRTARAGRALSHGILAKPYEISDLAEQIDLQFRGRAAAPSGEAQSTSATETSASGHDVLAGHIASLGAERVGRVIRAFLDSAPRHTDAVQAGLATDDRDAVATAAHSLAGASGLLGLAEVEDLARRIEARAGDAANPVTPDMVAELRVMVSKASRDLSGMCPPKP